MTQSDTEACIEAVKASTLLKQELGHPPWLRGIGVHQDEQGYFVKLYVSSLTDATGAPTEIACVRVKFEAVGDINLSTMTLEELTSYIATQPVPIFYRNTRESLDPQHCQVLLDRIKSHDFKQDGAGESPRWSCTRCGARVQVTFWKGALLVSTGHHWDYGFVLPACQLNEYPTEWDHITGRTL
jgi:hypothetical protein